MKGRGGRGNARRTEINGWEGEENEMRGWGRMEVPWRTRDGEEREDKGIGG